MLGLRDRLDLSERPEEGLLVEAKPLINGVYLMPPISMPHLAGDVIEALH